MHCDCRVTELLEHGSNPMEASSEGRTPYAVATNRACRDAFRRHMGAHPDQWDWAAAGVPSPLTPELEAHQAAKQVRALRPVSCNCILSWQDELRWFWCLAWQHCKCPPDAPTSPSSKIGGTRHLSGVSQLDIAAHSGPQQGCSAGFLAASYSFQSLSQCLLLIKYKIMNMIVHVVHCSSWQ